MSLENNISVKSDNSSMWGAHFFNEISAGARISWGVRIFCYIEGGRGQGSRRWWGSIR